jgi:Protein of unknown function (DUF2798)
MACDAFKAFNQAYTERIKAMTSSVSKQADQSSTWRNIGPNIVFGFILSGLMSLIVSGISSARVYGLDRIQENIGAYVMAWFSAYLSSWVVAFPVVLVVAPVVRKIVNKLFSKS